MRPVQDAERCRSRCDEASAVDLRARPRQPATLPQVRQSRPASGGDPATTGLAAALSPNLQGIPLARDIALAIRAKIKAETGLNASAGISYNKFLAKLASDHRKPNGQYVITPEMGLAFVENLPVGKLSFELIQHGTGSPYIPRGGGDRRL